MKAEAQPPVVFVIDDDPADCSSIPRLLRPVRCRVETHPSVASLFESERPAAPCCLILHIRTPDLSGLELKRQFDRRGIRLPIIFISGFKSIPLGVRAMKEGAVDFLTKPLDADELLRAVRRAFDEDVRRLEWEERLADVGRRFATLTARERDVCFAVTKGLLNKQAGAKFGVSEKTIKVHRARVMVKMGAGSLPELVRMIDALEQGAERV